MPKDTLPHFLRPLMGKPSLVQSRCAVCGRPSPLEQHHIVRRSAGKLHDGHGRELKKPTITLCGFGNNLQDADGVNFCHGLAHHHRLHFRWVEKPYEPMKPSMPGCGWWEYILLDEPTDYMTALDMEGWVKV